jgi:cytochrome b involved in lipid metabolism
MSAPAKDNLKQFLPVQSQKQRYYTLEEVSNHNTANDCWIILFGEVYNLTHIIQ